MACAAAGLLVTAEFSPARADEVGRYGVVEKSFRQAGDHDNPYTDVQRARATLIGPEGEQHRVPLFWDGGDTWRFRFTPEKLGRWRWETASSDPGLDDHSGRFRVVESEKRGGIEPMPEHPRYLQRQDGPPFYFMGDTAWALYTDSDDERHTWQTVQRYIDTRSEQGFNVVHSMLISEAGWGNSGGPAFHDLDAERINPAYWREVDRRVRYLNERGIVAGLALAWADKGSNPNNWQDFPSQEARERYARYIAARYGARNVYFIVSGEWNAVGEYRQTRRTYEQIGEALNQADPHGRMIAIHPYGNDAVRRFADEPWMSFADYQQVYTDLHGQALKSRRRSEKPVVNAEYAYFLQDRKGDGRTDKPNSATLAAIRHATWDIAMAGSHFITGFGSTYFGGHRHPDPFDVDAAQNNPWEEEVQHVRELFTSLDW